MLGLCTSPSRASFRHAGKEPRATFLGGLAVSHWLEIADTFLLSGKVHKSRGSRQFAVWLGPLRLGSMCLKSWFGCLWDAFLPRTVTQPKLGGEELASPTPSQSPWELRICQFGCGMTLVNDIVQPWAPSPPPNCPTLAITVLSGISHRKLVKPKPSEVRVGGSSLPFCRETSQGASAPVRKSLGSLLAKPPPLLAGPVCVVIGPTSGLETAQEPCPSLSLPSLAALQSPKNPVRTPASKREEVSGRYLRS